MAKYCNMREGKIYNILKKQIQENDKLSRKVSRISMCVHCSVVSDSFNPVNYSPSVSSVHGIFQARILKWVVMCFSRENKHRKKNFFKVIFGIYYIQGLTESEAQHLLKEWMNKEGKKSWPHQYLTFSTLLILSLLVFKMKIFIPISSCYHRDQSR